MWWVESPHSRWLSLSIYLHIKYGYPFSGSSVSYGHLLASTVILRKKPWLILYLTLCPVNAIHHFYPAQSPRTPSPAMHSISRNAYLETVLKKRILIIRFYRPCVYSLRQLSAMLIPVRCMTRSKFKPKGRTINVGPGSRG